MENWIWRTPLDPRKHNGSTCTTFPAFHNFLFLLYVTAHFSQISTIVPGYADSLPILPLWSTFLNYIKFCTDLRISEQYGADVFMTQQFHLHGNDTELCWWYADRILAIFWVVSGIAEILKMSQKLFFQVRVLKKFKLRTTLINIFGVHATHVHCYRARFIL